MNDNGDIPAIVWIIVGLAIVLLVLQPNTAHGADLLAKDKQQHIAVSALIAAPASIYLSDTKHPVLYSAAVAMIPGVLKELYDAKHPKTHTASSADLAADLIGAFSGALIGHGVSISTRRDATEVIYSVPF